MGCLFGNPMVFLLALNYTVLITTKGSWQFLLAHFLPGQHGDGLRKGIAAISDLIELRCPTNKSKIAFIASLGEKIKLLLFACSILRIIKALAF